MLLRLMIEETRKDMLNISEIKGRTSPLTVMTSMKLDHLLNLYQKKYGKLESFDHSLKVHGSIINTIVRGSLYYDSSLQSVIHEYGLSRKDTADWYSLEDFRSLFTYFENHCHEEIFSNIGKFVPVHCLFPDHLHSFENSLLSLNYSYHLNHSSSSAGFYEVVFDGVNEFKIICHTPFYPYTFNYGIIRGFAEKHQVHVEISVISQLLGGEFKVVMDK